ncbi:MAG: GHKL domain-containing protein, partial [Parvularculaceae bacterium]|nr:GHKL domain-containing protein [Parvularculaceae bacterium]
VELCNIVGRQGLSLEVGSLPLERVFADQTQIRMVMVNLINNALDAVTGQKDGGVIVRGHLAKMATIEVLDNGPGVAGDFEAQLFQPFASTKTRGLGIGLSICRTIAESHGGRLTYVRPSEQQDGLGGAMFRLELPWDEQTP